MHNLENLALMLMAALIVKHFLCDFLMQPPWMWKNKGIYFHPGGLTHATVNVLGSAFVLLLYAILTVRGIVPIDFWLWWKILAFEWLVHYHMDWWKITWCKLNGYKAHTHPQFWHWMGLDQMVHYLTFIVMVWAWI
jgi:hypothetical protein